MIETLWENDQIIFEEPTEKEREKILRVNLSFGRVPLILSDL